VKNKYGGCPKCGSSNVENYGGYEYPDGVTILALQVHCNKCKCDFTEKYTLVEQEVLK
jgi:predicted nucleic-acid-binding Zn-ribbon protein